MAIKEEVREIHEDELDNMGKGELPEGVKK